MDDISPGFDLLLASPAIALWLSATQCALFISIWSRPGWIQNLIRMGLVVQLCMSITGLIGLALAD
jgi:hypothetical protein